MSLEMLYLISIIGTIMTLLDLFKIFVVYKGRAEGKIIDCDRQYFTDTTEGTGYYAQRYTISYMVDDKTYIYQQKAYTNTVLDNKKIFIKYNLNKPQKSRLKGNNIILYFGLILMIIGIIGIISYK